MGSRRYEVEVTVGSARDLKNVNWRNGELQPYAVVWIDDGPKCSTRVDRDNSDSPVWDEKLAVPSVHTGRLEDAVLYIDVVHANADDGVKPLVGSARLPLRDVLDDGGKASRTLRLKRPSGRPQGRLDVRVAVREESGRRYYDPYPSPYPAAPPYGQPVAAAGSREPSYYGAGGYGGGYGGAPPQPAAAAAAAYGSSGPPPPDASTKSGNKMGMGTGLAVGAAAGVLGGLAIAGGASYLADDGDDEEEDY